MSTRQPEVKLVLIMMVLAFLSMPARAARPWPAEPHGQAVKLTAVDPGLNSINWSGAFWNPATRALWLACNSGFFWALVEDGAGGFMVATNGAGAQAKWSPGGDLEGICQTDFSRDIVYLLDENGWIREYDGSRYGVVHENRKWDIRVQCPEIKGLGPEGLAFVPDEWLRRGGYRGANGDFYTSTNGMGGLMFVGHQAGGHIHVFDLNPGNNQFGYVGRYKTGRAETAGLEFDRSSGKLYIWHNIDENFLEVTELSSYMEGAERRLEQIAEYVGPRGGNLEGFACVPASETNTWCFITDDNNRNGQAVMWYRRFQPSGGKDAGSRPDK